MNKYKISLVAIVASFITAWYSAEYIWAVREMLKANQIESLGVSWHITQWLTVSLWILTGALYGHWHAKSFNFHDFGRIIGVAVIGIPVYVFSLHWLLRI